jgi:hypothetical protein
MRTVAHPIQRGDRSRQALWAVVFALQAGLLVFSQTLAGYGDEGQHLVGAQLINAGKRPYLDFFFPHDPLYAYMNAFCLRMFGPSWRGPHVLAALLTGASIALVADYVYSRLEASSWRLPGASMAALFMGLNTLVIRFGTISQPYGACLFFGVAAFRLAIAALESSAAIFPLMAGAAAGAAAESSLLTSPIAPILLGWLIWRTERGVRLRKSLLFLAGCVIPFLPLMRLAVQGPKQVFFDIVQYHLFYRGLAFQPPGGLVKWDFWVLQGGMLSTQSLVLVGLAVLCLSEARALNGRQRAERYLAASLVSGLALLAARAHPVFEQYFVLLTPFLAMLAAFGFCSIGAWLWPARRAQVTAGVVGLFCLYVYGQRELVYPCWPQIENVGRAINQVSTPSGDAYFEYESLYFASQRLPPPGLENSYGSFLPLAPDLGALLHTIPQKQIDSRLADGGFAVAVLAANNRRVKSLDLRRVYTRCKVITCFDEPFYLFWNPVSKSQLSEPREAASEVRGEIRCPLEMEDELSVARNGRIDVQQVRTSAAHGRVILASH